MKRNSNNSFNWRPLLLAGTAGLALGLSGCGGGGGGGGTTPTPTANTAPVADAGDDQTAEVGALVTLDGSGSSDADGDALTFAWTQTAGPEVALSDAASEKPKFAPPATDGDVDLVFELVVSDGTDESDADAVTVTVNDVAAPVGVATPDAAVLGKSENIVVTFNEPMDTDSLELGGTLADEAKASWSADKTKLTLTPKADDGEWISGSDRTLTVVAEDTAGNASHSVNESWLVKLVFSNFQAADVVVGQPDMVSNTTGITEGSFDNLYGRAMVHDGRLYAPDYGGNRVLGYSAIPATNGQPADFVIGQAAFDAGINGTSDSEIDGPQVASVHDGKFFLTEFQNSRVSVYDPVPNATTNSAPGTISFVIGQADMVSIDHTCAANRLRNLEDAIVTPDGKVIVTDSGNNRVLIWTNTPTASDTAADIVLGQQNFVNCEINDQNGDGVTDAPSASTMSYPSGVWSDGEKLVVLDNLNNRALVWNTFPEVNGTPADLVLGQADMTLDQHNDSDGDGFGDAAAANTLASPYLGVVSNGTQLFITDANNNRVLIWDNWPTINQQPADAVLGQVDMLHDQGNDDDGDGFIDATPSARTLASPRGIALEGDKLVITDGGNTRYLIYNSQ